MKGWPSPQGLTTGLCTQGRVVSRVNTYARPHGMEKITGMACSKCTPSGCGQPSEWQSLPGAGPWGPQCALSCPTGEYLYRLEIRRGAWVDSVRGHCRKPRQP